MNRLSAIQRIRCGLNIVLADGGTHHFDSHWVDEYGPSKEIAIMKCESSGSERTEWKRISGKEALDFVRKNFVRREDGQCLHKYEMWDESGRNLIGHASCTITDEHFHCAACETAERSMGICSKICFDCRLKADCARRALTLKILDFEQKFGITFHQDADLRDQADGNVYESSYRGHRGEDFHADG